MSFNSIIVLKVSFLIIGSYNDALQKLKLAQETSDLESDENEGTSGLQQPTVSPLFYDSAPKALATPRRHLMPPKFPTLHLAEGSGTGKGIFTLL